MSVCCPANAELKVVSLSTDCIEKLSIAIAERLQGNFYFVDKMLHALNNSNNR